MHPSSTPASTPFSVKDILKLEHHHDFENEFLMTDQVVPMHRYDRPPQPCVPGMMQKKLDAEDTHDPAAEEEINEQGEVIQAAHHGRIGSFSYTGRVYVGFGGPDGAVGA